MGTDRIAEFRSRVGNVIHAPSQWTMADRGDAVGLHSPDGHAKIAILSFTVEGSSSIAEFRENLLAEAGSDNRGRYAASDWVIRETESATWHTCDLVPLDEADDLPHICVSAIESGRYLHGVFLEATAMAMRFNGAFYRDLVSTFRGIR